MHAFKNPSFNHHFDHDHQRKGMWRLHGHEAPASPRRSGALRRSASEDMMTIAIETKVEEKGNGGELWYLPTHYSGDTAPTSPVCPRLRPSSAGKSSRLSHSCEIDRSYGWVESNASDSTSGSIGSCPDGADMAACLQILLDTQRFEDFPFADFFGPENLLVDPVDAAQLLLGAGAEAKIFRAHLHGQMVAVKVSYNDSVLKEYSLVHSLNHPNILKTVGFTLIPGSLVDEDFIAPRADSAHGSSATDVMFLAAYQYAAGGDLASYLSKHPGKRIDDHFMTSVFDSILAGLEYLAARNILHGDIKPENILVTAHEQILLADFGMCQTISNDMIAQGTPSYMSPEVLAAWCNLKDVSFTQASDIFSFGVLMVRVLTGKYPYTRVTARLQDRTRLSSREIAEIFAAPMRFLTQIEAISPKFAVIAKMCMRLKPEERPTASALRRVLRELSSFHGIQKQSSSAESLN